MDLLKLNRWYFILGIFLLFSCDFEKEFDQYQKLENSIWVANDTISFEVDIKEVTTKHNVFLNVRSNNKYPFRNLFVISKMKYPSGIIVQDTLEYEMADAYGNWLGEGLTDVKNNKLYFLENYQFQEEGLYTFSFVQAMRKRTDIEGIMTLEGLTDVGLRIEKIQP